MIHEFPLAVVRAYANSNMVEIKVRALIAHTVGCVFVFVLDFEVALASPEVAAAAVRTTRIVTVSFEVPMPGIVQPGFSENVPVDAKALGLLPAGAEGGAGITPTSMDVSLGRGKYGGELRLKTLRTGAGGQAALAATLTGLASTLRTSTALGASTVGGAARGGAPAVGRTTVISEVHSFSTPDVSVLTCTRFFRVVFAAVARLVPRSVAHAQPLTLTLLLDITHAHNAASLCSHIGAGLDL